MNTKTWRYLQLVLIFVLFAKSSLSQVQLNGLVLEINSSKTPVANVNVKSDSANSVLSNTSGLFTLKFQEKDAGQPAYLRVEKLGWELVNEEEMDLYLPFQGQPKHLDVVVCKQGYLEQARKEYYNITDEYIKKEYKKKYDRIIAQKEEGWQQEVADLQEQMKVLENQLEKQAEAYIRTNRDFLSEKEVEAIELFEEGRIYESLRVRQSLNSEEELRKELENSQRAEENIVHHKDEKQKAQTAIALHRRNLRQEADLYILKFQFDSAEYKSRRLAEIDSANFESVFELGSFLAGQEEAREAVEAYLVALKLAPNELFISMTYNNLGNLQRDLEDYESAITSYQRALEIRKQCAVKYPQAFYQHGVAMIQNNLGNLQIDLEDYESALRSYQDALEIYKRLAGKNPTKYEPYVAMTQNNLGLIYSDLNDYELAMSSYHEALEIRNRLAKEHPKKYDSDLANTHYCLGLIYTDLNNYDLAMSSFHEALGIYKCLALSNPMKYKSDVAETHNSLGILYSDLNDYESALASYMMEFEIRKYLAAKNPLKYEIDLLECHLYIGALQLQFKKGRPTEIELSDLEMAIERCNNYPALPLAMTLKTYALEIKNYYKAFPYIEEITNLRLGIGELEASKKISLQREIILKCKEVQKLGYSYSSNIGSAYGSLAWYQLLDRDFKGAENSAKEAISPTTFNTSEGYDAEVEWVHTNLALALLFQGKYNDARTIYLEFKHKPYGEGTYKDVFLEDLLALEEAGITHPDVEKIRELLSDE